MDKHPKQERTLVVVKPDGIQRGLVGEIIKRYEQSGLKLVAIKMLVPTAEFVEQHYTVDPEWRVKTGMKTIESYRKKGKQPPSEDPTVITGIILANLKKYLSAGPVIAMVWQGMHAVGIVRKITGGTEPLTSDVGTIRGDYTIDSYQVSDVDGRAVRNLIHASGSVEEADKEIALWFDANELHDYRLMNEAMIYDPELGGIL
jgi:nucleoside-diphosphate kinase